MKLVVGYLATPGGADAVALGARLARTLGAELELCIVLPADRGGVARLAIGDFDDHLTEQAQKWLDEAAVPSDVVARSHVSFTESFADGLIREIERLEADAVVVGGSGGGLAGPFSLGSVVNELLHSSPVPVVVAPRGARHTDVDRVREVTCAIGERQGADRLLRTAVRFSKAAGTPLRLASLVALDPTYGHLRGDADAGPRAGARTCAGDLGSGEKCSTRGDSSHFDRRRRADGRGCGQQARLARRRSDHGRIEQAQCAEAAVPRLDGGQDAARA